MARIVAFAMSSGWWEPRVPHISQIGIRYPDSPLSRTLAVFRERARRGDRFRG